MKLQNMNLDKHDLDLDNQNSISDKYMESQIADLENCNDESQNGSVYNYNEESPILLLEDHDVQKTIDYKRQLLAVSCASCGVSSIGTVFSWPSSALPQLQILWNLNKGQISWIGAMPLPGMILGSLLSGFFGDYFGRKAPLILGNIPLLFGWSLLMTAVNPSMVYAGRFFTGFGAMMIMSGANVYIGEVSSPIYRGRFGTIILVMYNVGLMLVYLVGLLSWRFMTGIVAIPSIISIIVMIPMPESPRWLLRRKCKEDAEKSLQWLMSSSKSEDVSKELELLEINMKATLKNKFKLKDLKKKYNYLPLLQLLLIHLVRQSLFMQAIMAYASLIFSKISLGGNIYVVPIITEACKFIAIILSLFLVDRIGRKRILIVSGVSMGICCIIFSFSISNPEVGKPVSILAIMMFFFFYGIGWAPAPWFLIAELLPDQLRSVCGGAVGAYNRLLTFIAIKEYIFIETALTQSGMFLLIATICFIASFYVGVFIPEGKGKSLDEIRADYIKG